MLVTKRVDCIWYKIEVKSKNIHEGYVRCRSLEAFYHYFSISMFVKTVFALSVLLEYVATYIYFAFTWSNCRRDFFLFVRMKD